MIASIESARVAARRLAAGAIRDGFKPIDLHHYHDADGSPAFYRIRCKRDDGEKWIRPMHWNGRNYVMGLPSPPKGGRTLYRPRFPLVESDPVLIVEGEQKADRLAALGITATTSGGATGVYGFNWVPLRGRDCVIWPDNDIAGSQYAGEVAAILGKLDCTVRVIDVRTLGLPDKGDCVDWLAMHPNAKASDVLGLAIKIADSQDSQAYDTPEPLRRPTPPPEAYPVAELGPILAPACASLRRVIQAPDAVCGASLLAAASLAAQGLADVHNDGRAHPLSLWMLTVAESGERKSAIDTEAMRAAREYEKELAHGHAATVVSHDAELEEWNAKRDKARTNAKNSGGAGLADALLTIGPPPDVPLLPKVTVGDFTAEGLAKLLTMGRPSVGAFTDEAALVFGGHGMTKEAVVRTAGTLSKLWDSGTLDRVRASDGAVKLYGRRLALHLMAQPVIAERALSDDVLAGQGFLARCLLAWPESTAGSRPYCAENLCDDAAMLQYHARMARLLRLELPLAEKQRSELTPRTLLLTEAAAVAWRAVHNAIESAMKPGARYATVKPWASKAPEQCLRIAGVLTLVESPDAEAIDAATIESAAELALWHLNESARLAGTTELSPEVRDAEALLNWCHETGRGMLHSGAALRLGPARIRERERFMQAVAELERAGWAISVEGGAMLDGAHRRKVWRIVPKSEDR